jgi:hypothetical protein
MCHRRVNDAAKGPGMSLMDAKYRRHINRLDSAMLHTATRSNQFVSMLGNPITLVHGNTRPGKLYPKWQTAAELTIWEVSARQALDCAGCRVNKALAFSRVQSACPWIARQLRQLLHMLIRTGSLDCKAVIGVDWTPTWVENSFASYQRHHRGRRT